MKQRHINATLTITALALTTLILTALPRAGAVAPTVASLSTNPKRINESAAAHSFIRSPFVDSTPGTTTPISAAPRLERQPLESLTALNSTETTERAAPLSAFSVPSAASAVQSPGTTTRVSAALHSAPVMFIQNVGQLLLSKPTQVSARARLSLEHSLSHLRHSTVFGSEISTTNSIILSQSGLVEAEAISTESICTGVFGLYSPTNVELFSDYQASIGEPTNVGSFDAGTELIFYLNPTTPFCAGGPFLSTDPQRCRVTQIGTDAWQLAWEDWVDGDFNDIVFEVRLAAPVPQGPLTLSASSTYATTEPVVARTSVYNSSSASKTFNVTVSLLKDGATEASLTQTPTVAGYGTASLTFDFGTRAAGSYKIKAELWEGSTLIATRERDTTVLASDDQARALRWVDLLKRSADQEFQEGADLVADTDADALKRMGEELLGKAFSLLIGWIGDLGRAVGLLSTDVDSATATVSAKLTDLKRAWSMSVVKGLRVAVMEEINAYLSPQRQQVNFKQQEMYGFVQSHAFTWPDGLGRTLASYSDNIRSRVESEEISAVLQPPRFIGKSTLTGYRASYDFYDLYGKIFSAIALAAAVGVILISVFVSGGLSLTAIIPALATLKHNAGLIALGVTGLLGLIAIGMDTSFEHTVAPAITAQHAQSQDNFRAALESASGVAFSDFTTNVTRIERRQVSLATQLRNADGEEARPLVETYIYSPDGRVIEILSTQPDLSPGQRTTLQGDITLPPGPYRAVSAVHTRERIGLSTQTVIFQVAGPQVQFALSLADPQLTLGEALHATVFITNTDPISSTGELAIVAVSSDEENFQTWTVNLNAGASERLDYSFVPQAEGTYRLDTSVSDGYELLARQSAAYVVGAGASLALNYSAQALYDPGLDVTLPVTVANAGTVPTSTTFSLVTLDRLNDLTQVHSQTNTLALGAGADVSLDATALPGAQPGLYTSRLLLDGALHASLDFAVAAEDTLFADIYPDAVFHNVSDAVTLTVGIMDSAYNYTDATTDVTLWQPDGVTETVTMSSIATGQYEGSATAPITGTYIATVEISRPNYRAIGSSTYFVAGQRSSLWPTLEGGPILGQTAPLTVTVRNEGGLAIEDAALTLSGTVESLVENTNAAGLAVLWPTATVTDSYQLTVDKTGFAQTVTEVLVQVITDTVPPWLYLDTTGVANQTPLTVTGGAEAETAVTVNDQPVAVDAQGFFTVTVSLSEGDNLLTAIATDQADNSTTVTQTVNLDTVPPTLTVTAPRDGLFTNSDVVTMTGSTEVTASLSVSGTLAAVQPDGSFTAWTLLTRGESVIPVVSTDAASNSTTITRTVGYSPLFADFDYNCVINVSDIMVVAANWRCRLGDECYNENYDLDKDGIITVVDIMKVAARWGETCE